MVLEKTLKSPLDSKEIKPVNPEGNQPWILLGRTNTEAPILHSPDVKSQLTGKDPDPRKDWGMEEKGAENEMVGWHHRLSRHEFEQTLGDCEGQGSLAWGRRDSRQDWATGRQQRSIKMKQRRGWVLAWVEKNQLLWRGVQGSRVGKVTWEEDFRDSSANAAHSQALLQHSGAPKISILFWGHLSFFVCFLSLGGSSSVIPACVRQKRFSTFDALLHFDYCGHYLHQP